MRAFLSQLVKFVKDVAQDERIPARDKKMILAFLALIISPVDIIPDWIPIIGVMDDLVLMAIVLDYFFEVLDQEIILAHYPWGMKSYVRLRKASRLITYLTPRPIKNLIWKFESSPYKK